MAGAPSAPPIMATQKFDRAAGRRFRGWGKLVLLLPLLGVVLTRTPPMVSGATVPETDPSAPAQHVVVLAPLLAGYATIDHGLSHVAGVFQYEKSNFSKDILSRFYPGVDALPVAGRTAQGDPEILLSLRPDTVIAWATDLPPLARLGLPSLVPIAPDPNAPLESRLAIWSKLGAVSGHALRSDALLGYFRAQYATLGATLAQYRQKPAPRLAIFIGASGFGNLIGNDPFLNDSLHFLNARNASQAVVWSTPVTLDALAALDPDAIFLSPYLANREPRKLFALPEWQIVRAVRERKVYSMPSSQFLTPVLDEYLLLRWFAEILYPDLPHELRADYRENFTVIHNAALSDDDLDRLLAMKQNEASAGYERFARAESDLQ